MRNMMSYGIVVNTLISPLWQIRSYRKFFLVIFLLRTGAKNGEWLKGRGLPPSFCELATSFGSFTPMKKKKVGTPSTVYTWGFS